MESTVNQVATTNPDGQTVEQNERTFTQAEMDAIIADRLKRERTKYSDYEELKSKASKLDELEEANKSELQKATERANELESKLAGLEKQNEIRSIREKVAKESGIPASALSLLTGETEEACMEQAKAIMSIATPNGYPSIPDGGEIQHINKGSARDDFKEWANQANN